MKIGLLTTTYRRRHLDKDLINATARLQGIVIDVGGENRRRRGHFHPPQKVGLNWICLNVDVSEKPEVVADAGLVPLATASAHAVVCTEVLEHVRDPAAVINEAYRILQPHGTFIGSMPFLYRIHADPYDYQRYTTFKLHDLLTGAGFSDIDIQSQGLYFTVLADMIKLGLNQIKSRFIRWPLALFIYPLMQLMVHLDSYQWVQQSRYFNSYTTGYFFQAVKATSHKK